MEESDYDMIITTNIDVDVARANLYQPLVIAEDDTDSHVLLTRLRINGELLDIPNTYNVYFNYMLANGNTYSVECEIENGKVKVTLPNDALSLDDKVNCDITVMTTKQLTTHTLSVVDSQIVATPTISTVDVPLKTALFYIDSQLRVIAE